MTTIGHRIGEAYIDAGLSLGQFARLLNVSTRTVERWVTELEPPSSKQLEEIARQCGVSLRWLLTGKHLLTDDEQRFLDELEQGFPAEEVAVLREVLGRAS